MPQQTRNEESFLSSILVEPTFFVFFWARVFTLHIAYYHDHSSLLHIPIVFLIPAIHTCSSSLFVVIIVPTKLSVQSFLNFCRPFERAFGVSFKSQCSSPLVSSQCKAMMTRAIMQTPWTGFMEINKKSWIINKLAIVWIPEAAGGLDDCQDVERGEFAGTSCNI